MLIKLPFVIKTVGLSFLVAVLHRFYCSQKLLFFKFACVQPAQLNRITGILTLVPQIDMAHSLIIFSTQFSCVISLKTGGKRGLP